jgi:hypothetical protein
MQSQLGKNQQSRTWLWNNNIYPDDINKNPETYDKSFKSSESKLWFNTKLENLKKKPIPQSLINILKNVKSCHDTQSISDILFCNYTNDCIICEHI